MPYIENILNDGAYEKAANLNLEVVVPDDHTITLDIDEPVIPERVLNMIRDFKSFYPVKYVEYTQSSGGNTHVYIVTEASFTPKERIALQAILGSDPRRELFGFVREDKAVGVATLMFESPGAERRPLAV